MVTELKREAIDVAARALFEAAKCHTAELFDLNWEELPDEDRDLHYLTLRCKEWWRSECRTAIEALWRRGMISRPLPRH